MADLREIVRRCGGDLYAGGKAASIPGPGHSAKDRSLSLRISDTGRVIWHSFTGEASHRAVMDYLGLSADEGRQSTPADIARDRARREREKRDEAAKDQAFCAGVWHGTLPLAGSPAESYLWSRGLILDGTEDVRFHPTAPRSKEADAGTHPAMVSLVRGAQREPLALHITYIAADGSDKAFGKRSRLMFGPVRGGAVHLGEPAKGRLAVAEGIETAGSFAAMRGLPAWAALSTSGLSALVLPRGLRQLVIAADGDESGRNAALMLAERAKRVCDVLVEPAPDGKDWNDILQEGERV